MMRVQAWHKEVRMEARVADLRAQGVPPLEAARTAQREAQGYEEEKEEDFSADAQRETYWTILRRLHQGGMLGLANRLDLSREYKTLIGITNDIFRGIFMASLFYLMWSLKYQEDRPLTQEGDLIESWFAGGPFIRILLDPFSRLLTYFQIGIITRYIPTTIYREGYMNLKEAEYDAEQAYQVAARQRREETARQRREGTGRGESRFSVRTFLINKIMRFLKPVLNILQDKIVSLTDDQLDETFKFMSNLVPALVFLLSKKEKK